MSIRFERPYVAIPLVLLAAIVLVGGTWATQHPAPSRFDVIVVGAGPGGIGAAIQAAAMGSTVALVEETDWLGGQMTAAGVGTMDEGSIAPRAYGLYSEFAQIVTHYYQSHRKSTHTCYRSTSSLCVDPREGRAALQEMIARRPSITVMLQTRVVGVTKRDATVTGVQLDDGHTLHSDVVIDATEFGDLLPMAAAEYRVANGTSTNPPAPSACVSDFTYTAVVRKYPHGVPEDLRFAKPPPGYDAALAQNFAKYVQVHGADIRAGHSLPLSVGAYVRYRGLPDVSRPGPYDPRNDGGAGITRTGVNDFGNDAPASAAFVEDPDFRADSICRAKLLTLQLVYYLQHSLGMSDWSLADDEGYDRSYDAGAGHCPLLAGLENFERYLPVEPYVREARRLVGVETLTGSDIHRDKAENARARTFPDGISVGYFPVDMHGCRDPKDLESGLDSPADLSGYGSAGPFEVPLGTLVPIHVDGLLAAEKNISASRIAESAIRLQPIAFSVGQAAGALAALAAHDNVPPRDVKADRVRAALLSVHVQVDEVPR